MSPNSIHLRSENPALLVEFNLPPGTHARIGAALNAEISLPLAGLTEYACMIGRSPEGRVYVADPDGENLRFVELPAALPLPPYQFVIFHPVGEVEKIPAATTRLGVARPRGMSARRYIPAAIVAAVVIGLAALIVFDQSRKPSATPAKPEAAAAPVTPSQPPPTPSAKEEPKPAPEVVAAAKPATPEPKPEPKPEPPPAKLDLEALAQRVALAVFRLEVKDSAGKPAGTGTAFAISADGIAVTNFHVVEDGATFTARTTQGAEFAVSGVTATDPDADLALISLKASNLPCLELGESEALKIGAPVAVYGCPEGLTGTLSDGILSSHRTEAEIVGPMAARGGHLLQITAPISPGSSGSPVIDHTGKVIGVAVAILNGKASQNLNFVIPVEAVKKLRKDSLAGLARSFSSITPEKQPDQLKPKSDPDSVFFADPDFEELRRLAMSSEWIKAAKLARQMTERHPKSARAQAFHGIALDGLGLYEQAESAFVSGLALNPEDVAVWGLLGKVQETRKKTAEARASWKRGGSIAPDYAPIWFALANSYMRTSEYLDAISPLENLRRADHAQFVELLEIWRMLRNRPPELQALFDHFDGLDQSGAGKSSGIAKALPVNEDAQTTPEKLAAVLVGSFLKHGEGPDIQTELADYAATVNPYFDQGQQGRSAILKDITTYRAQWPNRSLRLLGIESARRDDVNTLEATYRLRFSASDGKRNRSGTLVQGIRYTYTNGRWLVSGIQTIERVKE